MSRLKDKTAVITGGGTGIGLGAARRFVEEGAVVYLFGRRQIQLDAAVAELGPNARAVAGSITDPADLDRLYATVKAERGELIRLWRENKIGDEVMRHQEELLDYQEAQL